LKGAKKQEKRNILTINILLILLLVIAFLTIGLKTYLMIQLPIFLLAGAGGVFLFYVQHQFEGVYWTRTPEWDPIRAALEGSSYFKMPKILQWFTGNIGLHHIHHLLPSIPNYKLQKSYDAIPELQYVRPVTVMESLKTLKLNLWDEENEMLISFKSLHLENISG
jgi:omega-6 fatty acid desaturase (delta-12 desaturase)